LASLFVAAIYFAVSIWMFGWVPFLALVGVCLIVPVTLIWFPEEVSAVINDQHRVNGWELRVPIFVRAIGWASLIGLPWLLKYLWQFRLW